MAQDPQFTDASTYPVGVSQTSTASGTLYEFLFKKQAFDSAAVVGAGFAG